MHSSRFSLAPFGVIALLPILAACQDLAASAPALCREFLWFRVRLFAIVRESLTG